MGGRTDDFGGIDFVKGGVIPFASALEFAGCELLIDDDFPTIDVVVCPAVALFAPTPDAAVTFDPGTSDERAAFILFPTLDLCLREREVLLSVVPSASLFFLAARRFACLVIVRNALIS